MLVYLKYKMGQMFGFSSEITHFESKNIELQIMSLLFNLFFFKKGRDIEPLFDI